MTTQSLQVEYSPECMQTLVADILREAEQQGATSAEVDVGVNKGFTISVRMGEVETVEYNQDKGIEVTAYIGKRSGSASLSDIRPEAIRSAVKAACHIARYTDEDAASGLAEQGLLAFDYPAVALDYPWDVTVNQAIELALECEKVALSQDPRIVNSEGVQVSTVSALSVYGNSLGFTGMYPVTRHEISCVLIAKQGEDMQRDYDYSVHCDPALLKPVGDIAHTAVARALKRLGARKLSTRQVPVIFIAEEARGLLGHFVSAISGGNLYRKSSFLVDQLGEVIFPAHIKIDERPHLARSLGSAPFDQDGVLTRPNVFIERGVLQSYALGVYSARKLGMTTTANAGGVHNLFVSTGKKDLAALLKTMGTGLLVTELMGQGVNIITGDYSRGAAGFWVENGEIQYPVEEITIAGNLRDMYANLVEVGADVDHRGNIKTGSILLEQMMVAGA